MRHDQWATSAPVAFAIAGVVLLGSLGTVLMTTNDLAGAQTGSQVEATNLNAQAEGLLRFMLESPGFIGPVAWDPTAGQDADQVTRLGLLTPGGSGYLDQGKFENLRLAQYDATDDGYVNYPEARSALGLDTQGLDFHIRAYPSLLEVRDKLAKGIKDTHMRVTYVGHVEGSVESGGGTPPTLGALTCTQSATDTDHYTFAIDVGGLNEYTHLSVSLGIRQGGTGPSVEATDVTEIAPADGHTTTFQVDVPNIGNVGCDATTTVDVSVSDPSLTLISSTLSPTPVAPAPTGASAREFVLSNDLQAHPEGAAVTLGYSGAAKDDTITWAVYDESTGLTVAVSDVQNPSPITVPNNAKDQWFSFKAPWQTTTGFYRVEATHTPNGGGATETSVRHFAVYDSAITIQPFTDPGGGATTASDAMRYETRWTHDLSGRFCAQGYDDASFAPMNTDDPQPGQDLAAERSSQCTTRVSSGFGGFPALNTVGRQGDIYADTKESANDLCRILLVGQADGACDWQNAAATLQYTNVIVIGSDAAHNNLVANDFKKSIAKWIDAGGSLVVMGSDDSRQWMQSGLGIGHASSSGGISSPDSTHPALNRPNPLDWQNYADREDQWNVGSSQFTTVTEQGGYPVTAVSNAGAYGSGNVFLTTWRPYDVYGTGTGTAATEGRMMLDNMLSMSYRDLYLDFGPELPGNAPAVPALGRGLIDHDKLGLIEMDFVMYVFAGA